MGQAAADHRERSVLLAEHDTAVAGMLARYLDRDGLPVRLAATPERALAGLADGTDPVAVLDLTMPGLDPRRVRQALRTPVVFLVAPGPRPRGLNGGGSLRDDHGGGNGAGQGAAAYPNSRRWVTRPFGPRLLVATVRDLLRQAEAGQRQEPESLAPDPVTAAVPSAGGLLLDGGRRLAVVAGREVPLTETEFAILAALLASPGRARSRRQLLTAAGRKASDRAADVYVAQLRAKIGVPDVIRTIRGAGYAAGQPATPVPPELGGGSKSRGQ